MRRRQRAVHQVGGYPVIVTIFFGTREVMRQHSNKSNVRTVAFDQYHGLLTFNNTSTASINSRFGLAFHLFNSSFRCLFALKGTLCGNLTNQAARMWAISTLLGVRLGRTARAHFVRYLLLIGEDRRYDRCTAWVHYRGCL